MGSMRVSLIIGGAADRDGGNFVGILYTVA